jgi:hypothetical protein
MTFFLSYFALFLLSEWPGKEPGFSFFLLHLLVVQCGNLVSKIYEIESIALALDYLPPQELAPHVFSEVPFHEGSQLLLMKSPRWTTTTS